VTHTVHLAQLSEVIDELERISAELDEALSDADAASHRLHGTWDGDASTAHTVAHTSWSDESHEMAIALAEMRALLRGAHENYSAAVAANTKMWG
jgi:WXG100 family type VII secretion target